MDGLLAITFGFEKGCIHFLQTEMSRGKVYGSVLFDDVPITGVVMPSALSKLTMLSMSRRLLAPCVVDLSLSLALISVFLLLA